MSGEFRLVRDTLGFYSQVPLAPEEEAAVEKVAEEIVAEVVADPPVKHKAGRPKNKLNAEFEVDV